MSVMEKIANAGTTSWIAEGLSDAEIKTTIELEKISARIEGCRLDLNMTQKEFAGYMGVSQGMVSKWESREYNFTVRSLNEICQKLGLSLELNLEYECSKNEYTITRWDSYSRINKCKKIRNVDFTAYKEAIA